MTTARLVLGAMVVAAGLALGFTSVRVGADATPPARVARLVDEGRKLAPYVLGPGGQLPFRFVEAKCSGDGRTALLYENVLAVRFYAVVGPLPPPDSIDPVLVIAPMTVADFDQGSFRDHLVPCGPDLRPLAAGEHWLPVFEPEGPFCPASAMSGVTLRGSPDDPRVTWMDVGDGRRREVAWPPGFRARFSPSLEVLDPEDHVVARDGDLPAGHCGGPNGTLLTDFLPRDWYLRWYLPPTR